MCVIEFTAGAVCKSPAMIFGSLLSFFSCVLGIVTDVF